MNLTSDNARIRIRIEAARVAMAIPFRADRDLRYYLNGVQVCPSVDGGANVIATDGHAAIVVRDATGQCDRATILPIGKGQMTYLRQGGHVLVNAEGTIWITNHDNFVVWISPVGQIEGRFPDLTKVVGPIAEYREGLQGTFNPALLDRIRRVRRPSKYAVGVRFYHRPDKPNSCAVCSLGSDGFVVVMPMRDDKPATEGLAASVPTDFQQAAEPPTVAQAA